MIAATVLVFAEDDRGTNHWKTSLHVGELVALVARVHYVYMREYWVQEHRSPVVVSFWIIFIAMIAAASFLSFFAEAGTVNNCWKSSLQVGGVVPLVVGAHHMFLA